jgi:hypothetical protein
MFDIYLYNSELKEVFYGRESIKEAARYSKQISNRGCLGHMVGFVLAGALSC